MNKKGFTLIELLMVIVLIGILALILSPNIVSMINKNDKKSCESLQKNIISATKMYISENKYDLGFDCNDKMTKFILKSDLVTGGYLSETKDISSDNKYFSYNDEQEDEIKVAVTYNCATKIFSYEPNFNCNNS